MSTGTVGVRLSRASPSPHNGVASQMQQADNPAAGVDHDEKQPGGGCDSRRGAERKTAHTDEDQFTYAGACGHRHGEKSDNPGQNGGEGDPGRLWIGVRSSGDQHRRRPGQHPRRRADTDQPQHAAPGGGSRSSRPPVTLRGSPRIRPNTAGCTIATPSGTTSSREAVQPSPCPSAASAGASTPHTAAAATHMTPYARSVVAYPTARRTPPRTASSPRPTTGQMLPGRYLPSSPAKYQDRTWRNARRPPKSSRDRHHSTPRTVTASPVSLSFNPSGLRLLP